MGKKALSKSAAIGLAWKRGQLSYKLKPHQLPVYASLWEAVNQKGQSKYVVNCARRYGKSFITLLIAFEYALRHKNVQIRFAAPTHKALLNIIRPIANIICQDAPDKFKPEFLRNEGKFVFHNGSEIYTTGVNGDRADDLRGSASHLNIVDEAGFVDDLHYLIKSVLTPMTLTTGGKTLIVSTPAKTPDHPFDQYLQEAEAKGAYSKFTIYDNTSLTPEDIKGIAEELGGFDSTDFKRECLCERVVDENLQIVPEWKEEFVAEDDLAHPYQKFWHRYTCMDLGVKDLTAGLLAHYNFSDGTLYIDDEFDISGPKMTTDLLQRLIKQKEDLYRYGNPKVYRRISDNNNLHLLNDLSIEHNLPFAPVRKSSLEQMVNQVRLLVGQGRIKVNSRCKKLLGCLRHGIWNERHKDFARSEVYGHYDHLAALVYLVISIDKNSNPVPVTYGFKHESMLHKPQAEHSHNAKVLRLAFGGKRGSRR